MCAQSRFYPKRERGSPGHRCASETCADAVGGRLQQMQLQSGSSGTAVALHQRLQFSGYTILGLMKGRPSLLTACTQESQACLVVDNRMQLLIYLGSFVGENQAASL